MSSFYIMEVEIFRKLKSVPTITSRVCVYVCVCAFISSPADSQL